MNARAVMMLPLLSLFGCDSSTTAPMHSRNPDAMLQFAVDDLATPPVHDMSRRVFVGPLEDMSMAGDFAFNEDAGSNIPNDMLRAPPPDGGVGGCGVRINEIMVGTTQNSSQEFVELYNSCPVSQKLKNWSLEYRAPNNNGTTIVPDLLLTIGANGFLVWGGSKLPASQRNGLLKNGLRDDTGAGLGLVDDNGQIVDSVAWGKLNPANDFTEGTPAVFPTLASSPGNSIARSPDGADSDNNLADFQLTKTPTPKMPNVIN